MLSPAIFLDRDGTLIEQVHHLSKVEDVKVYDFTREALQLLTGHGYRCVIVTNQSAIGRGLLNEAGLNAIHEEMLRQLGQDDLVHGIYYCPLMPISGDPTVIENIDRKPGPGMLQRAARELNLDLERSWMIGDAISDILAGRNAGCRGTVLVRTGYGRKTELESEQVASCKLQGEQHNQQPATRNPQLADSHSSLLPTSGGEGGRRPDEGGDHRFEDKVAGCTLQVEDETKELPRLRNFATPQLAFCPAIDYVADNLLAAARLIVELDQS